MIPIQRSIDEVDPLPKFDANAWTSRDDEFVAECKAAKKETQVGPNLYKNSRGQLRYAPPVPKKPVQPDIDVTRGPWGKSIADMACVIIDAKITASDQRAITLQRLIDWADRIVRGL